MFQTTCSSVGTFLSQRSSTLSLRRDTGDEGPPELRYTAVTLRARVIRKNVSSGMHRSRRLIRSRTGGRGQTDRDRRWLPSVSEIKVRGPEVASKALDSSGCCFITCCMSMLTRQPSHSGKSLLSTPRGTGWPNPCPTHNVDYNSQSPSLCLVSGHGKPGLDGGPVPP